MAVAIGKLRDEEIVTDEQRLLHRAGRDVEGLKQKGADDQRDNERMEDHAHGFAHAPFLPLCAGRHTHVPLIHRIDPRAVLAAAAAGRNESRRDSHARPAMMFAMEYQRINDGVSDPRKSDEDYRQGAAWIAADVRVTSG